MDNPFEEVVGQPPAKPDGKQCPACGFFNPLREPVCLACCQSLGDDELKLDAEAATSRYRFIKQQVEQLQQGSMSMDQFREWLEGLMTVMAEKGRAILENIEATNYAAENVQEVETGLAGVKAYEGGVNELWQYVQDSDASRLPRGLEMIWDGNQRIIAAMRINRESRESLRLQWDQVQDGLEEISMSDVPPEHMQANNGF